MDGGYAPSFSRFIEGRSLAARIRRKEPRAGIVAVAGKDFIPFLFGGNLLDIGVYPPSILPEPSGTLPGWYRIRVFLRAGSQVGLDALVQNERWISRLSGRIANHLVAGSRIATSWRGHTLRVEWLFPNPPGQSFTKTWRTVMAAKAHAVDQFYHRLGRHLVERLACRGRRFFIQSWFSTDTYGHVRGNRHRLYQVALEEAVSAALRLHADGYSVVVTSDHGGTHLRQPLYYDSPPPSAETPAGVPIPLPRANEVVHSGDHLVGYESQAGPLRAHYWDGTAVQPLQLPPHQMARSHGAGMEPSWLLLPTVGERFTGPRGGPGGDHGAAEENGRISDVDNEVPLVALVPSGVTAGRPLPTTLDELADFFMSLP